MVTTGLGTLVGPRFTVQQATTTVSSATKTVLTYTHRVLFAAHERYVSTSKPVVGATAVLQVSGAAGAWHRVRGIAPKPTHGNGGVKFAVKPHASSSYRVYFQQTHENAGAASSAHAVQVLPYLHLRSLHTVGALTTTAIKGSIHPHLAGTVYLQKSVSGQWQRVKKTQLADGHFSFEISPKSLGHVKYRVVRHRDNNFDATTSRELNIQVVHRSLHIGDTGKDVLALQKRLAKLHYDVGPRNGSYGYDTLHAVTAFEKVNGLAKDGSAGPGVWNKLNHPKQVHLKHPIPSAKLAVEVNIPKQILILARYGNVWRILDTSTAGGYFYTNSAGQSEQAITPTGHFTIQYKQTGWQKSKLGELYYPSYFTNTGYAIHGEGNGNDGGEVPPYPNSHGCVRITDNAVNRYYDLFAVGVSVWIY
jgi:peptidoglycan hydrolase-like protein with peptidoglycan-binding domain